MNRFLVLDTETDGLDDPIHIVEIAWIELVEEYPDEWVRAKEFQSYVNIGDNKISDEASAINGITSDMLIGAPTIEELPWPTGAVTLVCHNIKFDKPLVEEHLNIVDDLCTLILSRRLLPDSESHKLSTLMAYCDLQRQLPHRALGDARVVADLLQYLKDGLGRQMQGLIDFYNSPWIYKTMPWGKHRGKPMAEVPKGYLGWLADQGDLDKDMLSTLDFYLRRR